MTADYDRGATMRAAWSHWRYARSKGWHIGDDDPWTWPRCIHFAAAQARARRPSGFAAVEAAMAELIQKAGESAAISATIRARAHLSQFSRACHHPRRPAISSS